MRTWMVALLLLGVGTAGAMKMWRDRSADPQDAGDATSDVAAMDRDSASADEPMEAELVDDELLTSSASVEDESAAPAPFDAEAAFDGATAEAPSATSDGVDDQPGGATLLAEGEARRKAAALVELATKSTNPVEQAKLLTEALQSGSLERAADEKAYEALLDANQRGLLNPRVPDHCLQLEVAKGDSLWVLCRRLEKEGHPSVTAGLIRLVNGMKSDSIRPGMKLKVPNKTVSIVVEKAKYRLSVFIGDLLLRRYAVALGKDNKTPEGDFTIKTRLVDPPWFKPGFGELPANHPENVLGTRWLGFAEKEGFKDAATFGIHGTRDDDSIGTQASNGCVRMHNRDVEELFEWVGEGVAVVIRS